MIVRDDFLSSNLQFDKDITDAKVVLSDVKQASAAAAIVASPSVLAFAAATLARCFLLTLIHICVYFHSILQYNIHMGDLNLITLIVHVPYSISLLT